MRLYKKLVLNEGLEELYASSFSDCDGLKSIVIPESVKIYHHEQIDIGWIYVKSAAAIQSILSRADSKPFAAYSGRVFLKTEYAMENRCIRASGDGVLAKTVDGTNYISYQVKDGKADMLAHVGEVQYQRDERGHTGFCSVCQGSFGYDRHEYKTTLLKKATFSEDGLQKNDCICGYSVTEAVSKRTIDVDLVIGVTAIVILSAVLSVLLLADKKKTLKSEKEY